MATQASGKAQGPLPDAELSEEEYNWLVIEPGQIAAALVDPAIAESTRVLIPKRKVVFCSSQGFPEALITYNLHMLPDGVFTSFGSSHNWPVRVS